MKAYMDPKHNCLMKAPFSTWLCLVALVASLLSAAGDSTGTSDCNAALQVDASLSSSAALQVDAMQSFGEFASDSGNRFIQMRSPLIKVPSPEIEDLENTPEAPVVGFSGEATASVGMRVVHLWKRTVGHYTPQMDMRERFLGVIVEHPSGCFITFVASTLLIYVAIIVVKMWLHQVSLRAVRVKIRRANEFFLGTCGDRQLCLHCVEFMPDSSPSTITFLCGHSFHVCCAKECGKKKEREDGKPYCSGRCPICPGVGVNGQPVSPTLQQSPFSERNTDTSDAEGTGATSSDLARLFTLHSICEKHPGVLSEEEIERLATQPIAVLQSEIRFGNEFQRTSNARLLRANCFFGVPIPRRLWQRQGLSSRLWTIQ